MGLTSGSLDGQPPHLVHEPSGARVWFIEPFGLLTQTGPVRHVSVELARFFAERATDELFARQRAAGVPARFHFLHDWTGFVGYTSKARKILTDWGLAMRPHSERVIIATSPMARVVRMAVSVGAITLQLAGVRLEVVDSLEPAIERLGVRPQPA